MFVGQHSSIAVVEITNSLFDKWNILSKKESMDRMQQLMDKLTPDDLTRYWNNHVTNSMLIAILIPIEKQLRELIDQVCVDNGEFRRKSQLKEYEVVLNIVFHHILPSIEKETLYNALHTVFPSFFESRCITVTFREPKERMRVAAHITTRDEISVYYERLGIGESGKSDEKTGSDNIIQLTKVLAKHYTKPDQDIRISDWVDPKRNVRIGRIFPVNSNSVVQCFCRQEYALGMFLDDNHESVQIKYVDDCLVLDLTKDEIRKNSGILGPIKAMFTTKLTCVCLFPDTRERELADLAKGYIQTSSQFPKGFMARPLLTMMRGSDTTSGIGAIAATTSKAQLSANLLDAMENEKSPYAGKLYIDDVATAVTAAHNSNIHTTLECLMQVAEAKEGFLANNSKIPSKWYPA
jgi:hypothetical protein